MKFLGKNTQGGGSPTLFATDRETYVVQGWRVHGDDSSVEIPRSLLRFLEPGTALGTSLHDTGQRQVSRHAAALFEPGGQFAGGASTTDPVIVDHCRQVHHAVWQRATPHQQYAAGDHDKTEPGGS